MKLLALPCMLVLFAALAPFGVGDTEGAPQEEGSVPVGSVKSAGPGEQHVWLQQLVGEWDVTTQITPAPGAEPVQMESTESVRAIGGLWVLSEGKASFGGAPFTSIMTLGFDPREGAFVGTWVDTVQPYMWKYRGELDEAGKVLTLETEGPSFEDPDKLARYRDAFEIVDADHKALTSSVMGEDGAWTTFIRADFRRRQ